MDYQNKQKLTRRDLLIAGITIAAGVGAGVGTVALDYYTSKVQVHPDQIYQGWHTEVDTTKVVFDPKPEKEREGRPPNIDAVADPKKFGLESKEMIGKKFDVTVRGDIYSRIGFSDEVIVDVKPSR